MAKRITMKSGRLTRSIVAEKPPFPRPGDLLTVKGEGAEWTVTKVRDVKVLAVFSTARGRLKLLR